MRGFLLLWSIGSRHLGLVVVAKDLVAPKHVGSSQTRNQTNVPCIGREGGHGAKLCSPVQQSRLHPCPELERSVWATSDQTGQSLGQAEPWSLSLSSPKGKEGHGSPLRQGASPRCPGSPGAGELWAQDLAQHKRVPGVSGVRAGTAGK